MTTVMTPDELVMAGIIPSQARQALNVPFQPSLCIGISTYARLPEQYKAMYATTETEGLYELKREHGGLA